MRYFRPQGSNGPVAWREVWPAASVVWLLMLAGCGDSGGPGAMLAEAVGLGNTPTPSEAAEAAFNPYDADERRRAVTLLANASWGGQPPYLRTYRLLIEDPDPTVRAAAISALGLHGDVTDVPRLTPFLSYSGGDEPREQSELVRWEAAKALQRIHHEEAIDALVTALESDPDVDVRIAAANALGQYASRTAFDALVTALRDDDYAVVKEAQEALTTLTGEDLGDRARAWWNWAESQEASLFADQREYYYPEYQPPPGILSKVAFWSDPPEIERKQPRRNVVAMDDAAMDDAADRAASPEPAAPAEASERSHSPEANVSESGDRTVPSSAEPTQMEAPAPDSVPGSTGSDELEDEAVDRPTAEAAPRQNDGESDAGERAEAEASRSESPARADRRVEDAESSDDDAESDAEAPGSEVAEEEGEDAEESGGDHVLGAAG